MDAYTIAQEQDTFQGALQTVYHVLRNGRVKMTYSQEVDARAYVDRMAQWAKSTAKIQDIKKGIFVPTKSANPTKHYNKKRDGR